MKKDQQKETQQLSQTAVSGSTGKVYFECPHCQKRWFPKGRNTGFVKVAARKHIGNCNG